VADVLHDDVDADGGVGGGEIQNGAVSPYLFDKSPAPSGRWPGSWNEREDPFRPTFLDQHLVITGQIPPSPGKSAARAGTETGWGGGVGAGKEGPGPGLSPGAGGRSPG